MCACNVCCLSVCLFDFMSVSLLETYLRSYLFIYFPIFFLLISSENAPSDVDITPVGCYKENASDLAMQDIFYNELGPEMPNFAKSLLPQSSENYNAEFPDFLLKCARKAKENKWEYFGVRELGEKLMYQIFKNECERVQS